MGTVLDKQTDVLNNHVSVATVTQASDAGLVTQLTCSGSPIWVLGITLRALAAVHANLTACTVEIGDDLISPLPIDATLGAAANISVTGERVVAAAGTLPVRMRVGDVIATRSTGTGSGAMNHALEVLWWGEDNDSVLS